MIDRSYLCGIGIRQTQPYRACAHAHRARPGHTSDRAARRRHRLVIDPWLACRVGGLHARSLHSARHVALGPVARSVFARVHRSVRSPAFGESVNLITKTLEIIGTTVWLDECEPGAKLFEHHINWCHGRHRCAGAQATQLTLAPYELAQREAQLRGGAQLGRLRVGRVGYWSGASVAPVSAS